MNRLLPPWILFSAQFLDDDSYCKFLAMVSKQVQVGGTKMIIFMKLEFLTNEFLFCITVN